jgi:hypothetical protein
MAPPYTCPEPLAYYKDDMLTLNRSAIIIKPKQPFLDWLHAVDSSSREITLAGVRDDPSIYLLAECEDDREVRAAVRAIFDAIFVEQLEGWYGDRTTWPAHRTFGMFGKWFEIGFHSMVMDLGSEPLITEDLDSELPANMR